MTSHGLDALRALDPDFFAACADLVDAAHTTALDAKTRELVALAVNSAVTHLHEPAVRRHVRAALDHGATREEIMETFQLVSVLGIHAASTGFPLLRALPPPSDADAPDREAIKAEFIERRGYWDESWEDVLQRAPAFFAAYLNFSAIPWTRNALQPKVKELIYIAIDASATHMFTDGLKVHIANAITHGATPDEIATVLEIASTIGIQTLEVGVPILQEELDRRHEPHHRGR
ncbi:alkylhydroperoxidase/carboxymuconolactone decarboxylase family protein YurZ [Actinomadura pelletieri DSM 43383]|uniref:Alkylhydroperoxidase/carboxymuconolactone decarboxylase family protein YurZ n=1 Tax=Actinomadura pelletieri DSM 43383 TaxID=1120940 RepID=A0A495QXR5_9ACTN|nr:carboxymuconolactone decarboxylase family protein [Actinomadura pelletieri]RKS78985.1 alkylhydroperoxidase/carboxymuconolactone decarboxylase family protein YurZ [Actinomadura pelletieri DSM 43383]